MNTLVKDSTANSFIEALELAYNLNGVEHPAERLSIRLGDDLVYGKDYNGAVVNKLDPNVVALLSAVAIDEKPPLELALEDKVLNEPIDIQVNGFTVLNYCNGIYKEKLLLEQLREDEKLEEAFVAVKDKADTAVASSNANALAHGEGLNSSDILISEELNEASVMPVAEEINGVEMTSWQVNASPETLRILEDEVLRQRFVVVSNTQMDVQYGIELGLEAQALPELQQKQPLIEKVVSGEDLQPSSNNITDNAFESVVDEQAAVSDAGSGKPDVTEQAETSVIALTIADDISINSGASRLFVQAAENNLATAIAETSYTDDNEAVDAAYRDLLIAKDVNLEVDASLRNQQAHKLMAAIVAIGMASGKDEIKTKGGEYVVELGSDGSALLRSTSGVIYDGLPNIKQASINLMSDLDINSLSRSVEHTAAYMREVEQQKEKEKEKQLEI
ncbi:hypothetical protein CAL7716_102000 (plasmid) [Calothrix sp. PCC 7716]|nr:hypothetical protein CAL7716_102000 [Calothrix sp. PCC 7716]